MKLSELLMQAGLQSNNLDLDITNMSCDSRQIKPNGLFFAMQGTKTNGIDFIEQAVQNGAVCVVSDQYAEASVPVIVVTDIRVVMARMANALYPSTGIKKVAITGTNGKTSTVYYVSQIMNALGTCAASMGTIGINSPVYQQDGSMTTPDTILLHRNLNHLARVGVKVVAMEASSHGLDQERLAAVDFEAGGFSNITQDHLDYHKTMRAYFEAKMKLFERLAPGKTVVLNADITEFDELKEKAVANKLNIISYGYHGEQLRLLERKATPAGQSIRVNAFGKIYDIDLDVVGDFQVMNILCAAGLCVGLGADSDDVMQAVFALRAPEGRLERVATLKNGAAVYVDYAHTPDALERVLKTMRAHTQNRLLCVFGCGGNRDTGKRPQMGAIADKYADKVYVTDDNPRLEEAADVRAQIVVACPHGIEVGDRHMAILTAVSELQAGDVLVLAGKGHEKYQLIQGVSYAFDDKIEAQLAVQGLENIPLWTADELKVALGATVPASIKVFGVSIDTRTLQLGDLFVALSGENMDGHAFVKTAVQKGASACLVNHLVPEVPECKQIVVPDVMLGLNKLGWFARNRSEAKFIAVTGSSGKTTTKEMLKAALSSQGETYATSGNFNNHIGVPLTLARMPRTTQYAVIEMGMNHKGELTALSALVRPNVSIITMIGSAHLEYFKDEQEIAHAKAEIFSSQENGTAVLNADCPYYALLREQAVASGVRKVVSFGYEPEADFVLKSCTPMGQKMLVQADWHGTILTYEIGFLGEHFAMNSLAVLAAVDAIGASAEQAAGSLADIAPMAGRGAAETVHLDNNRTILLIDDAYNANPSSMAASIRAFGLRTENEKVAVLGDMRELGPQEIDLHKGLKDVILGANISKVFAVGTLSRYLFDILPVEIKGGWTQTPEEMADLLIAQLKTDSAVLVKASNGSGLKKIIMRLKGTK